jgi:hypothetical protein
MSDQSNGLWNATFGQMVASLQVLEDYGLTPDDLQRVRADRQFAAKLVAYWRGQEEEPYLDTETQAAAREIMRMNFLGLEEVRRHYGIHYSRREQQKLAKVPYSTYTLERYAETHLLVAGYPLTILDILRKNPGLIISIRNTILDCTPRNPEEWLQNESWAKDAKVELRWHLIPKTLINRAREWQMMHGEYICRACEITYAVILYYLARGERLLPDVYATCADVQNEKGPNINVGCFKEHGFEIHELSGVMRWSGDTRWAVGRRAT